METTLNTHVVAGSARVDSALRVAAVVSTFVFVALLVFVPPSENDFWLQARIGQLILETGSIPRTLLFPFSWVKDNPFNAHEWLPSLLFHGMDRLLGEERLVFALGGLGLVQFALCFVLARRLSGSFAAALLLAGIAMLAANYRYHLRPEIFALLLMVALLTVLYRYQSEESSWVLLWSLPIAVLWANSHGSFVLGPVIAGLFAVGEAADVLWFERRRLSRQVGYGALARSLPYAAVAVGMLVASTANPLGVQLLRFVFELSASDVTKAFIQEWSPTLSPLFMAKPAFPVFLAVLGGTAAVLFACRRQLRATDLLLVAAFAFLAFQRLRFVVLFGFVALAVCARLIGASGLRRERALLAGTTILAGLGAALVFHLGNVRGAYPFASPSTSLTQPMIAQLSNPALQGNVFNSYELGAELVYRAYPRLKPSIDSRIDSYGDRYFLLHQELFVREALLQEFIKDYDVRYMLLMWRDFELLKDQASMKERWRMRFADHKVVLLQRRDVPG